MSEYYIRAMVASELKDFYPRIKSDFAAGEYPPMDVLYNHLQEGRQEGFVLSDGTGDLAYSFCAANPDHEYILITLLAVFQQYRGMGIGSTFLNELHKKFVNERAIIVEVEKPEEARTVEERDKRLHRIAFYEKEGYRMIKGLDYTIWDIPLHLMAFSSNDGDAINKEIKQIMHQIYFGLLGKQFIHKMQFRV